MGVHKHGGVGDGMPLHILIIISPPAPTNIPSPHLV